MEQAVMPSASKELKLEKMTIVKLNMMKVGQLVQNGACSQQTLTTGSTAPQCDITTTSVTTVV